MSGLDYTVIVLYIISVFIIGAIYAGKIKNSKDMFSAGGESPWWLSGMSSYMTMFSAGTFVVWGGIAFKSGLVAVSICLCNGVAAILIGYFIAARWKRIGVSTGAEFIRLRFGKSALQFYTWTGLAFKMLVIGVALYSVAVLLCALMPLHAQSFFADPQTGNLSVLWAVILCGGIVVIYTVIGGLWAVLLTDVLQFIVLTVSVLIVIPLIFFHEKVSGLIGSSTVFPEGFFSPVSAEFTWIFLVGWTTLQFFSIGGEWGFIQRFLCVPTELDAKKSAWLFGVLYLFSAFIWMLPPMIYRIINPSADPKEAYILACKEVLPAGMVGLMIAAMFSATASTVSTQLNVFSSVLTMDFYKVIFRPLSTEKNLVLTGRLFTLILGFILVFISISVPSMGGVENLVLSIGALIITPLMAPAVWGLLSKKIMLSSVWLTAGIGVLGGVIIRFGFSAGGFLTKYSSLQNVSSMVQANYRTMEIFVGVLLPICVLAILECRGKKTDKGWLNLVKHTASMSNKDESEPSDLPAKIIMWNIAGLGIIMMSISIIQNGFSYILFIFSSILLIIALTIFTYIKRVRKNT